MWFNVGRFGEDGAKDECWRYVCTVMEKHALADRGDWCAGRPQAFGPLGPREENGLYYHGAPKAEQPHCFFRQKRPFDLVPRPRTWRMRVRDTRTQTTASAEEFCGNATYKGDAGSESWEYECRGHSLTGPAAAALESGGASSSRDRWRGADGDAVAVGDGDDDGVYRAPPDVGIGDPSGDVPLAEPLAGSDSYEVHPARGAAARVHVES